MSWRSLHFISLFLSVDRSSEISWRIASGLSSSEALVAVVGFAVDMEGVVEVWGGGKRIRHRPPCLGWWARVFTLICGSYSDPKPADRDGDHNHALQEIDSARQ